MEKQTIRRQIKNNLVAIISLVVAITALLYTAWREETTEKNRTLRVAGFEVLKNLGELQIVVNHTYYQQDGAPGNPFVGWGHVALISDLSELLPPPVPETIEKLINLWSQDWKKIKTDEKAASRISDEIDHSRKEVLESIRYLK